MSTIAIQKDTILIFKLQINYTGKKLIVKRPLRPTTCLWLIIYYI